MVWKSSFERTHVLTSPTDYRYKRIDDTDGTKHSMRHKRLSQAQHVAELFITSHAITRKVSLKITEQVFALNNYAHTSLQMQSSSSLGALYLIHERTFKLCKINYVFTDGG